MMFKVIFSWKYFYICNISKDLEKFLFCFVIELRSNFSCENEFRVKFRIKQSLIYL